MLLLHQCFGSFWRQPAFDSVALNALLQILHALLVCVVAPQPVAFIATAHREEGGSFLSATSAGAGAELAAMVWLGGGMQVCTPVFGSGSGHQHPPVQPFLEPSPGNPAISLNTPCRSTPVPLAFGTECGISFRLAVPPLSIGRSESPSIAPIDFAPDTTPAISKIVGAQSTACARPCTSVPRMLCGINGEVMNETPWRPPSL